MHADVDADHIVLGQAFSTRREVVQAIGEIMLACGDVTPRYVEGMLEKEEQGSTWITEGVALPHGVNAVKNEVLRTSLVFIQIPLGVDWGGGKIVHLAIGVAGRGADEHVKMLTAVARVLQRRDSVSRLRSAVDKDEVSRIFGQASR